MCICVCACACACACSNVQNVQIHIFNSFIYSASNHMYSFLVQAILAMKVYSKDTMTSYVIDVICSEL